MSGLERLGESDAFGDTIVDLLEKGGFTVDTFTPFAGGAVGVSAKRNGYEIRKTGETLSRAAMNALEEASHFPGLGPKPLQLQIV